METIHLLRRRGHSIHIDDFGTGYSNLDNCCIFLPDTIKIDQLLPGLSALRRLPWPLFRRFWPGQIT